MLPLYGEASQKKRPLYGPKASCTKPESEPKAKKVKAGEDGPQKALTTAPLPGEEAVPSSPHEGYHARPIRYGPNIPDVQKADSATIKQKASVEPNNPIRYGPQVPGDAGDARLFEAFSSKALIRSFDEGLLPVVGKYESYNDDISIEHFQSAARHYAGKQRRGVVDEHMECLSMMEHIDKALSSPFFLSLSVPLPASIIKAATFLKDSPPELILSFWDEQLKRLDKLVGDSSKLEGEWKTTIPPETAPATGKLHLPALMSLAVQCQTGGTRWLQQFLYGFPLVGRLGQPRCYPFKPKESLKKAESTSKLFNSTQSRFADRACKSGFKNAKALWDEALDQCKKGWLNHPFPLSTDEKPYVLSNPELNIAFRFGVEQGSKLRACDDLRHSRTNLACVVETPIKLVSWDHLAELTHLVNDGTRDWAFMKADHEAAYKQLPLDHHHAKLAVIALRSPTNGMWYGFISRTLMFGAIAAVLHYNVFSRLLSELVSKLLGIPLLCFFDDFGAIVPASIADRALAAFTAFCTKLGIKLKVEKSEVGQKVTFLGLLGHFPCHENNFQLSVTLTPEKASKWVCEINGFIKNRSISSHELEKLIGKLGFSQTSLFGKFARTQLSPLYKKFYSRSFTAKLSFSELKTLHWWAAVLSSLQPRIPRPANRTPDFVVYTDAALLTRRLAALVLSTRSSKVSADLLAVSTTPTAWFRLFHRRNPIIGMEMLAPLALLWTAQSLVKGRRVNLYIDNDTASNTLIRGDCADAFLAAMIKAFWKLAEKLQVDIWIGRVGSPVNPADLPTRRKTLPFPIQRSIQFKSLFSLLMEVKRW